MEFAYNNTLNATTGISPFFANKGYNPGITVHPEHNIASRHTLEFTVDLNELYAELWQNILLAISERQEDAYVALEPLLTAVERDILPDTLQPANDELDAVVGQLLVSGLSGRQGSSQDLDLREICDDWDDWGPAALRLRSRPIGDVSDSIRKLHGISPSNVGNE